MVLSLPIVLAIFGSPTHDFDRMTSQKVACHVFVDSRFVREKIRVNIKSGFDRAKSHDFLLHMGCGNSIPASSEGFVFGKSIFRVGIDAFVLTLLRIKDLKIWNKQKLW